MQGPSGARVGQAPTTLPTRLNLGGSRGLQSTRKNVKIKTAAVPSAVLDSSENSSENSVSTQLKRIATVGNIQKSKRPKKALLNSTVHRGDTIGHLVEVALQVTKVAVVNQDAVVHTSKAVVQKGDTVVHVGEVGSSVPMPSTEAGYAL